MQRMTTLVVSVLALSALLGGTAIAAENQPPLADAGLDQSVERATTVQLDANGSRDPDGTVEAFEWTIEAPDGTTRTPDCPTCVQTTFSPAETGQYNVTVTVTDDDGASRSDTLHVDVVAAGGPSVSVSAPTALPTDSRRNLTANVTAGDADLRTLAWVVNGTPRNQTQLTGINGTSTITHTFNESGPVSVRAIAYDAAGRRGVANRTIQVAGSSGTGGRSCPAGSSNYYVDGSHKGCTSAAMEIGDTHVDVDGKPGLWTHVNGELTQIIEPEDMNRMSIDGRGDTFTQATIDEAIEEYEESQDDQTDIGGDDDNDSYDSVDSTDSNSNSDGNTRPGSSVPNNLMDPDDDTSDDEDGGGYHWDDNDDDDDSSSSDSSSDDDDSSDDSSSDDDNGDDDDSSDDSSSDDDNDDDDGGFLGGLIGGDDDDSSDDSSSDDDDDDDDGGGWFGGGGDDDDDDSSSDDDDDDGGGGGWSWW
ncbi:PKD domain-containing protein [Haloarcula vallismortis]|uniref:PKD/Chitinase domain-containing protein n=2 Tax=Haloarcula vallismortis TaxID=28442 RepID=M0JSL3_HALVA|nr:PKD domain-containing protein [Haloarcula vallismortis]EMA11368.1 hypothetical protein C437_00610 [Haloarcula vallismortis ATCC 29715]SDW39215.1 PKD domain-containing protein [Haloarcula vallismortis]